jgi:hypothetical protein
VYIPALNAKPRYIAQHLRCARVFSP